MADEDQPEAGIGHNSLNHFLVEARALLRSTLDSPMAPGAPTFRERRDQFLASAKKVEIKDRHDAGAAADLVGLSRDIGELVDEHRRRIGKPHDDTVRAINTDVREFWDDVDEAMKAVQAKIDAFATAEDKRIADQAAEQAADEARRRAASAPAGAPPPEPPATPARAPKKRAYRGDFGRQAIMVDQDVITIDDVRALPDLVLNASRVKEEIVAVLKPMVRNGMEIAGITVTKALKSQIRK